MFKKWQSACVRKDESSKYIAKILGAKDVRKQGSIMLEILQVEILKVGKQENQLSYM